MYTQICLMNFMGTSPSFDIFDLLIAEPRVSFFGIQCARLVLCETVMACNWLSCMC